MMEMNKLIVITSDNRRAIRAEVDIVSIDGDEGHAVTPMNLAVEGMEDVRAWFINPAMVSKKGFYELTDIQGFTVFCDNEEGLSYIVYEDTLVDTLEEAQNRLTAFIEAYKANPTRFTPRCIN